MLRLPSSYKFDDTWVSMGMNMTVRPIHHVSVVHNVARKVRSCMGLSINTTMISTGTLYHSYATNLI